MIWIYDLVILFSYIFVSIGKPYHFKKLFAKIPDPKEKKVFWLHAVSVGEVKAAKTLFELLRKNFPSHFFLVTTTTLTGQEEAKRSLSTADATCFLPIDLSPIVRRWVKKLKPELFVMVESDLWPNLLHFLQKNGCKTALVSGKLSTTSQKRFLRFPFFAKRIFSKIDLIAAQNEEHFARFSPFTQSLKISGNLKFDSVPDVVEPLNLSLTEPAITVSCTHFPEEKEILENLPLESLFTFLAPRHPERFEEVAALLQKRKIPFFRWSRLHERKGGERVLLVDAMGKLPICYSLSRLAIVAGSFHSKIGGHNLLEPCFYGIPVLFGPHVFAQTELATRLLSAKAGLQVTYETLRSTLDTFLQNPSQEEAMREAAKHLVDSCRGACQKTFHLLKDLYINP